MSDFIISQLISNVNLFRAEKVKKRRTGGVQRKTQEGIPNGRFLRFLFSLIRRLHYRMAMSAAVIGAISNTLRLELVDLASLPPAAAAFFAAMIAGLLASAYKKHSGFPRIAITVPSIVIMVPGLYLYRAIYNLGMMNLSISASWFASATLIILALPLGLIFARIMTDKMFRYCT